MLSRNSTLQHMSWFLFGLTLLFIVVWQAPAFYTVQGLASYLPLHMFAESFSIVVSMMVFGVAWNVYSTERPGNIVILACALLAVGLIDFAHMLSFKGMPDFISASGPEKAINLWLAARLIAALALLTVAMRSWQQSYSSLMRHGLLAISLSVSAVVIWLGLVYPQVWPRTFIAGQGLTPFKIGAEYTIIAILLIPAVLFYVQTRRPQSHDAVGLFAATVITILSELSFTVYSDVADIFNLLGHVYKIMAYMFIYRAVFLSSVREPFLRLDTELAENQRISEELRTASLYTRSLIEANLDPLVTISAEGKITDLNQATEVATGRSRSELIGTDFSDCFAEPDRARKAYRHAFLKGFVSDYSLVLHHRDGHFTNMLYNASVYKNEKGEVLGVLASARDITEHRRAELVRSQLAAIVESSSDAIIGKTPDGIITSWNKGAENIYGYSADEIVGKPITMLEPPSLHAEIRDILERVGKGDTVSNYESERIRKDGTRFHVALTLSPIRDDSGNISGISTIARDITQRKLDEAALQRLNRELRAISNCNLVLMRAEDEQTLLGEICRIVCDEAGYRMAWVGYPESDEAKTIRLVAWAGVEDGYLAQASITWADTERGRGPSGTAIRNGKSACIQDFSTDPLAAPWRESAMQRGYCSSISLPLKDESTNIFGNLTIYSAEPNAFTPEEIRLLEELAGDLAFGIIALRTRAERKRMESLLSQREHEYRTLAENSPDVIVRYDREGRRIYVNPEFERVNRLTAQQVHGKTSAELSTELKPRADVFTERLMAAMESGTADKIDLSWDKDGKQICWFVRVVPEFDANGKVTSALTIWSDITERKQAEQALRDSRQRMDNIVANSPSAIYRCANDPEWTMEFLSAAITQITGYPADDFLNNRVRSYASIIHPDDRRAVEEAVSASLEYKDRHEMDYRLIARDGTPRWVHEQGRGVFAPDGRLLFLDGVIFDITGQRKAEEEIRQLNQELELRVAERTAQLEEANKELESFSYSVSHDLRTPLRAIDGFSHILLEDYAGKLDDEGKRLLNVVRNNTSRMGQLIDDILKFSRSGRLELTFSEIDMEKLAYSVFVELRTVVAGDKLQLELEHIPPARGDNAMMRQVLVNLMSNAIKFSRKREAPKIHLGATVKNDETIYYVQDNGVGFNMQYGDKLFGIFQRLHSMEEFEGTGIGLAIVKRIITRHGGRVWAEGKVNEGATLFFALPNREKNHE